MEEKERYELNDNDCIIDNEKDVAICDICDVSESLETLVNLLNQQDKRIKELEQDKTKFMDLLNSMTENWWVSYEKNKKLRQENEQLKQQLAEKDKKLSEYVKIVDDLHKQLSDKCDFCDKTKDQDKISFAVEQLEKVKNYMITDEKDMFGANYLMNSVYVLEFIDNQIKELKGEK